MQINSIGVSPFTLLTILTVISVPQKNAVQCAVIQ